MVVWIVYEGWQYGGKTVRGVFSTQEKAERLANQVEDDDCGLRCYVEPWEVDVGRVKEKR